MASTATSTEMLQYFSQLNEAEQESIVNMLRTFVDARQQEPKPSLQEYNREIEQADAEIEGGEFISHEEVMKNYIPA